MTGITISESIYYLPRCSDITDPCVLPTSHSSGIWNIFSRGKSDRDWLLHTKVNRVQSADKLVFPQGKFKKTLWSTCIRGKISTYLPLSCYSVVFVSSDYKRYASKPRLSLSVRISDTVPFALYLLYQYRNVLPGMVFKLIENNVLKISQLI